MAGAEVASTPGRRVETDEHTIAICCALRACVLKSDVSSHNLYKRVDWTCRRVHDRGKYKSS